MNINTKLTELRNLEYFEGALLSHFKDESTNKEYIWIWVDVLDRNTTPWTEQGVMTETTQETVDKYMNKEITLRQLLTQNTDCFLVTEKGEDILNVEITQYTKLNPLHQVKENTFHNEDLRPENY